VSVVKIYGVWNFGEPAGLTRNDVRAIARRQGETPAPGAALRAFGQLQGFVLGLGVATALIDIGGALRPGNGLRWLALAVATWLALVLLGRMLTAWGRRSRRRRWLAWGFPLETPVTYEVGRDGLVRQHSRRKDWADWPAVTDVIPTRDYWVLLAAGQPLYVPRRLFADGVAEREFIEATFAYLSEPARQRSAEALAVARSLVREPTTARRAS
jgi:hypothetical protein